MLASINPLGERARNNRWWLTAYPYLVASAAGGAALGGLIGAVGAAVIPASARGGGLAAAAAVACWGAAVADLTGRRLPGLRRQVNEDWLASYRGWVYGVGFGAQLGAGLFTIVTTATVYLCFGLALLSGSPGAGAGIGVVFGVARAVPVLTTARIDGPEALRRFHRRMQAGLPLAARLAAATAAAAGTALGVAAVAR
ncbi:MAG TPA: hypothetical protein VFA11_09160 [Acidimicrobiales bacterium]|nr:hypothetical protein [Acidimicrobiales bacterium]